jgi:Lrp/AsnC family transcriptional regulator, leucine-responsive regulatory protein
MPKVGDCLMKPRRNGAGLDDIDRRILGLLQVDCKTPLAKIGEKVGLSAPSVVERVRKLEGDGFITGYHAKLDARKLGVDVTAFIGVSIRDAEGIATFEKQLEVLQDVLECHHVTGGYTLLLKIKTRNTQSLEALIRTLRSIAGVERTETSVVLSTKVERTGVGSNTLEVTSPERSDRVEA